MILAGLAASPTPEALALTEQLSADATVKAEAEIAWLQIAKALVASQPNLAEASLNRLAANASDNNVRTNAQVLVKQFTSRWLCAGPYRQPGKSRARSVRRGLRPGATQPGRGDLATGGRAPPTLRAPAWWIWPAKRPATTALST